MLKERTPWIKDARVFNATTDDMFVLKKIYGCKNPQNLTMLSIDFAAYEANVIIERLISKPNNSKLENKNG